MYEHLSMLVLKERDRVPSIECFITLQLRIEYLIVEFLSKILPVS